MERRVLIVESQTDLALTMASVLKDSGFQTSLAASAADAQRELEKRRPDLVVLRAELPDQNGFSLCGVIRKGRFGPNLPVILLSSDVGPEALHQHSQSPNAANAYLPIPFEMGELSRLSTTIVPSAPTTSPPSTTQDDMDADLDNALSGRPVAESVPAAAAAPHPLRTTGGPPRLPRRERRSALTDEDKQFLDRAFQSIADRKAELLAESREVRRPPSRREMGTPEAKIQILRDELKSREAQIARISEIWSVRERELTGFRDATDNATTDVLLYSGFSAARVQREFPDICGLVDAVMTGPFVRGLPGDSTKGSGNQQLLTMTDLGRQRYRYEGDEAGQSGIQVAASGGSLWMIGIPVYGDMDQMQKRLAVRGVELSDVSWRC